MSAFELKKDVLYAVGVQNPTMRIFDVIMKTEYGTSYNSYIIKGTEKTVLIETCHLSFFEPYLNNIKEVCKLQEIDYIVLNHCEPDHSGVLKKLTALCPKAKIITSQPGSIYLKHITNNPELPLTVVKDGSKIDLGGKELTFFISPFLHWPDSMFTWCEEDKTLFSCDFLGAHFCEPYVVDKNVIYKAKYETAFKEYFDAIFGPFKPYVLKGLDKIKDLDIDLACTSHGPVLTKGVFLEQAIQHYAQWSKPVLQENKQIPIFYCSAYGNTGLVANAVKDGILKAIPTASVDVFDIIYYDMGMLAEKINASDAFCIGSPTINADALPPVWVLLSHVDAINSRKKGAIVFGSYGWSGEAVPNITARLTGLKMNVFGEGFRVQFVPSGEDLLKAQQFGFDFASSLNLLP